MTTQDEEPLAPEEQRAFDALPREARPPAGLEDRVLARLRAGGHLRRRRPVAPLAAAAAVLLALGAGFAAGRLTAAPAAAPEAAPADPANRYAILLYGEGGDPAGEEDRVREYGAWARATRAVLSGEKLDPATAALGPAAAVAALGAGPSGFFIVRAAGPADAEAVAASCPHLRHGGTVVVRPIADTR